MQLTRTRMPVMVALFAAVLALPACATNKPSEVAAPAAGMEGGWRVQVAGCNGTLTVTAPVTANVQYVGDLAMACGKDKSAQPVTVLLADNVVTVSPLPADGKGKIKGWLKQPVNLVKGENLIYGPQSSKKNAPVVAISR